MTWYIKTVEGWKPWVAAVPVCSNSNDLQGVHRSEPLDVIQAFLARRAERFLLANAINNRMEKEHHFRGDSFIEPLYGAYGETL